MRARVPQFGGSRQLSDVQLGRRSLERALGDDGYEIAECFECTAVWLLVYRFAIIAETIVNWRQVQARDR